MNLDIINILKQPFPFEKSPLRILIESAIVGLFVALFLLYFQPFGNEVFVKEGKSWILWGYGMVTFLVVFFNMFFLPKIFPSIFNEERWKVYSEICFDLFHIPTIWLGNSLYAFSTFASYQEFRIIHLFESMLITISIGIIPIFASILLIQNRLIFKYQESTDALNRTINSGTKGKPEDRDDLHVSLSSESGKETFDLNLQNLLLIKSIDNYVEIYTENGDQAESVILRSSLKRIEENVNTWPFLFRCHRTYLVNIKKISRVSGNSQGYKLAFDKLDFNVPVSRNNTKAIQKLIN